MLHSSRRESAAFCFVRLNLAESKPPASGLPKRIGVSADEISTY